MLTGTEGTVALSNLSQLGGTTASYALGLAAGRVVVITQLGTGRLQLAQVVVNTDKTTVASSKETPAQ